ncbi:TonB family protein [Sphingomonas sp. Leaf33]|uniref:TonB family protein n=1 Tax=Sphingomonas sp. Leaf33 TaxID=1736215 RepID=UPI00138F36BE|nr:TonB family protein [Sphingomonas sp. Leaf33]
MRSDIVTPARFSRHPAEVFGAEAYLADARAAGQMGRVVALIAIDRVGAINSCKVFVSSSSAPLDKTTCQIATRKLRMKPAKDAAGAAIPSQQWFAVNRLLEF